MTQAQYDLIVRLAGGLDSAMQAAEDAGFDMVKNCGKSAKIKDLMSISVSDASGIIDTLKGAQAPTNARLGDNLVNESAEENGYMVDRGEDN